MAKPFDEYSVGETFESYARTITEAVLQMEATAELAEPLLLVRAEAPMAKANANMNLIPQAAGSPMARVAED